jgi:hypothetical protein
MIFDTLDFHLRTQYGEEPVAVHVPFRLRINYIVDSFSLRIPKKTKAEFFRKLNVCAHHKRLQKDPFFAVEGVGMVEIVDPNISSVYQATAVETVNRVKTFLKQGIWIAAQSDRLFAVHLELWEHLLSPVDEEFDFDLRVSRYHRSRRWRCDAVMRITPTAYHYDVLIRDSKTLQTIQRHRIKTTECARPLYRGIGFSELRWEKGDVVGITRDDKEVFRLSTELQA